MCKEIVDLGYANGWRQSEVYTIKDRQRVVIKPAVDNTPQIVKDCQHTKQYTTVGRCLTKAVCEVCGFSYLLDSSD